MARRQPEDWLIFDRLCQVRITANHAYEIVQTIVSAYKRTYSNIPVNPGAAMIFLDHLGLELLRVVREWILVTEEFNNWGQLIVQFGARAVEINDMNKIAVLWKRTA